LWKNKSSETAFKSTLCKLYFNSNLILAVLRSFQDHWVKRWLPC
jgi:hypothetical protein